jgi:hypothetical protein
VSTTPPAGQPEPQWQQPEFQPEPPLYGAPLEGQLYTGPSGQQLVSRPASLPPSVPETVLQTLNGLVWPVMIVLAIMGTVGWWPAIITALVANVVLENVRRHLRSRRRAIAARANGTDDPEAGLR